MKIAITGGSGFIGNALVKRLYPLCSRIVIYSRSESKQAEMKQKWPELPDNIMRYMIGDVRDEKRMVDAFKGCDCVVHAAALKRVEVCEYDPVESVKTNIDGTINVVRACNSSGVKKAIFISTDKAVEPITIYGATKLAAERVWIASNALGPCRLSAVRYANVEGSTGSLLELWRKQATTGRAITITHPECTRMWITQERATALIHTALNDMQGGEIFIADCEKRRIQDMAANVYPLAKKEVIGLRPSEKLHEMLISECDARSCYKNENVDIGEYYVVYPSFHSWIKEYDKKGILMPESFRLSSFTGINGSIESYE